MARYILYPAVGATVLDENGNAIPPQGAGPYTITAYYQDKLTSGLLLRVDPLASGETPNLPPGPRTSIPGVITANLSLRAGSSDGEIVVTSGYAAPGDGGGASWRFALGVSAGTDGRNKINASNGQYQRLQEANALTLKGAGCVLDGTADDSAALSAVLNAASSSVGATVEQTPALSVQVGQTSCAIASTVTITGSSLAGGLKVRGNGGRNPLANGVRYVWTGAPGSLMFDVRCYGLVWENAHFAYASGSAPLSMVNMGPGSSMARFDNCYFKSAAGLEPATYGLTTDILSVSSGNCENVDVYNCFFEDFGTSCIAFAGNSQPFNWLLTRPVFLQYGWPAYYLAQTGTQKLRGAGISGSGGYTFRMIAHDANACESVVRGNCAFYMIGGSAERCKQLYDGANATGASLNQLIENTRFGIEDMGLESVGPRGVAAGVKHLITKQERGTITMVSSDITGGPDTGVKIVLLNGAGFIGRANNYANMQPFSGDGGTLDSSTVWGGLYSIGDSGTSGAGPLYTALPPRTTGSWQAPFTFTLVDGDGTSKVVTFSDSALYQPNLRYRVKLTPIAFTGSPSAGSLSWSVGSIAPSGFTVTFGAAVGAGATRDFYCEMEPY